MRRAVFLDRDGVINKAIVRAGKPYPPASIEEIEVLPGVKEAMKRLHQEGFLMIVITNQPDVARGTAKIEDVERINEFLSSILPIDAFKMCYHDNLDGCSCRKPLPGLLFSAARDFEIDLSKSFMVGDRWRDIEAGFSAGCTTFFIDYKYDENSPKNPDFIVSSLLQAEEIILREYKNEKIRRP